MLAFPGIYILSCPNEEGNVEHRVAIIEKFEDLYDDPNDLIMEKINDNMAKNIWSESKVFNDSAKAYETAKKLESKRKELKGTTTFVESHNVVFSYSKV